MSERKYALVRAGRGDYLTLSNDGNWLWRFSRYEDGEYYGLVDCGYERRWFWRAKRLPNTTNIEGLDSEQWDNAKGMDWFRTRREAIEWAMSQQDMEA